MSIKLVNFEDKFWDKIQEETCFKNNFVVPRYV